MEGSGLSVRNRTGREKVGREPQVRSLSTTKPYGIEKSDGYVGFKRGREKKKGIRYLMIGGGIASI